MDKMDLFFNLVAMFVLVIFAALMVKVIIMYPVILALIIGVVAGALVGLVILWAVVRLF